MSHISAQKVFAHLDRLAGWQRGDTPAPVTVEWDLSDRCPLGCQSCHFAHTHSRGPWTIRDRRLPEAWQGTGDLADTSLVMRGLRQMAAEGVKGVVWSGGGEPTTHPDWPSIVVYAQACDLQQGMYTMGGLLTAQTAPILARAAAWVVVSLDCVDGPTYAQEKGVPASRFEAACNGIRLLAEHGCPVVGVSFLLHQGNWTRIEEMVALGRSLGATYTMLRPTIDTSPDRPASINGPRGWISGALPILERLAKQPDVECDPSRFLAYRDWTGRSYDTCHGIKLNATITPDGRVWVCPQRRGIEGACVGDLRTESFAELWARHPGVWTDFSECRAMCRLHLLNEQLAPVFAARQHEAFV